MILFDRCLLACHFYLVIVAPSPILGGLAHNQNRFNLDRGG